VQRRNRPEMMDEAQVDESELADDLRNLAWFNRLFGGIAVIRAHLPRRIRGQGHSAFRHFARKRERSENAKGREPKRTNIALPSRTLPFPSFFALSLLSRFRASLCPSTKRPGSRGATSGIRAAEDSRFPSGSPEERWTVLDVATGGGDIPRWLARRKALNVELVAADLHPQMLQLARRWSDGLPIRFLRCDARRLPFRDRSVEFVLCSQMLHHLTEADAVGALREMGRVTRRRLIVHDLRRSRLALVLIWLVTRFSRNRLTRYDSPTSFERAFTPSELEGFAREAELDRHGCFRVYRHLYFRMALVYDCAIAGEG
jgi:SAM-dependent methyltransferase